jgi:hypothetical protein
MDYLHDFIVEIDGVQIPVEFQKKREKPLNKELLARYCSLLETANKNLTDAQKRSLETLVDNMTETAADKTIKRIKEDDDNLADSLIEIIDATMDDPKQESVMINGNKFLFEKGSVDIKKYAYKLYEVGEKQQGDTWTIYLDGDGELVIY